MVASEPKEDLLGYLRSARDGLLAKLDGLSPYDARRPMTPTATNLLGLVKHVAFVQAGYLGATFGRPFPDQPPWETEGAATDDDMWVRADESTEDIVGLFRRSSAHADATVEALPLDAVGHVPWWPAERREVTLHRMVLHMVAEVDRHAGQADIVRELIDGTAGLVAPGSSLPERDPADWETYRNKIEAAARAAIG
jgi:uncharacterized damage-inducible protein DinB